ncbi:MAG: DUF420 domain-containing protein [Candidatus Hydrogenedens sp.]|nr:DUF420 domain-containing protein [Candidatus Hydrogenedens sp.]
MSIETFPLINASLNGLATVFLVIGGYLIKTNRANMAGHRAAMLAGLVCSAAFLSCYLYYHYHAGSVPYQGQGALRYIYFTILLTHIPLAILMTPFILAAVFFAFRGRFDRHVKIVKWVYPVWLYVSITGVLIYLMLYPMGGSVG